MICTWPNFAHPRHRLESGRKSCFLFDSVNLNASLRHIFTWWESRDCAEFLVESTGISPLCNNGATVDPTWLTELPLFFALRLRELCLKIMKLYKLNLVNNHQFYSYRIFLILSYCWENNEIHIHASKISAGFSWVIL